MILDRNILLNWKKCNDEIDLYKKSIDKRVKEIYKKIFKLTNQYEKYIAEINYDRDTNEDYCYDCGTANNPIDHLGALNEGLVCVTYFGYYRPRNINIIMNSGLTINLVDNFPQNWLFEDFEQELTNGLQKYKDMLEQKKAKTAATKARSKEDKLKSIELIKSKLSAEELELVSFKKK